MRQSFRFFLSTVLAALAGALGGAPPAHAAQAPAPTTGAAMPAAARLTTLDDLMNAGGGLKVPKKLSGSIYTGGETLVPKPGRSPLFLTKGAGDDGDRWVALGANNGCIGAVFAMASLADGRLVVGGDLSNCGSVAARNVAIWDPATGQFETLGYGAANGVNDDVFALAVSGSDIYVGGRFTEAGGASVAHVARFNTLTKSWHPLGMGGANGVNNHVYAIAVSGDEVLVGGGFDFAGGLRANGVALFRPSNQTWISLGTALTNGVDGIVYAIAIVESGVFVAGNFGQAGGGVANNIAFFSRSTQTWSSLGLGTTRGVSGPVFGLYGVGGDLYLVGSFMQAGDVPANRIARFNLSTQTWTSLGSGLANGLNGIGYSVAISEGNVYVGGAFSQAGGAGASRVARFDISAQAWSPLGIGVGGSAALALCVTISEVFVGGDMSVTNGGNGNAVVRFNEASQTWSPLGTAGPNGLNEGVNAIDIIGNQVFVAGSFTEAGGLTANRVARFDADTSVWSSLGSGSANGLSGSVRALAVIGRDVYVGGSFTQAGGVTANAVARFNLDTETWSSLGNGVTNGVSGGSVSVVVVSGDDVYVGGTFTQAGGIDANKVARFNTSTETWHSLGSGLANGVDGNVHALAVDGDHIYVGGAFTTAGGALANRVARFGATDQTWASLGAGSANGVSDAVFAITLAGGDVYVGGFFTEAGGMPAKYVARFNTGTQGWSSLGVGLANGVNGVVFGIEVVGGDVFVGGFFTEAGGVASNNVAKFRPDTDAWSPLGSGIQNGVNSRVNAVVAVGDYLYVGGAFSQAGEKFVNFAVRADKRADVGAVVLSSVSSVPAGASATLTATVTVDNFPVVRGSARFLDGATPITGCDAVPLVVSGTTGNAECVTSALPAGVRNFYARYSGDELNFIGTSDPVTITVSAPTITVSPSSLPGAATSTAYSQTLSASGSGAVTPFQFVRVSGALPPGLSLNAATGELSGTPTQSGSFSFRIAAVDSSSAALNGPFNGVRDYTLAVSSQGSTTTLASNANPAVVNSAVLLTATVDGQTPTGTVDFRNDGASIGGCSAVALTGSGNSRTAQCVTSQLPAGTRSLTAVYSGDGINGGSTSSALSQTISAPTITVSPASLPGAFSGTAYSQQLSASGTAGSFAPFSFAVVAGSLPPGLGLTAQGLLSGTPTVGGSYSFTIAASDSNSATVGGPFVGTRGYALTVATEPTSTTLTSAANPSTVNTALTLTASVTGVNPSGTVAFLNGGAGIAGCGAVALSGSGATRMAQCVTSALAVGSRSLTASYSGDSVNAPSTSSALSQTITAPALEVLPASLATLSVGVATNQSLSTNGPSGALTPFTYAVTGGALPAGLAFSNGVLSGSPSAAGAYSFTVTATDASSAPVGGPFTATRTYSGSVVLQATSTTIGTITPSPSEVGQPYQVPVTVTAAQSTPTGVVQCSDGAGVSESKVLAAGAATCTLTSLVGGAKTIRVTYNGSTAHEPSVGTASHTVQVGGASDSTIIVGQRLAPRGREVPVPVSIRGNGTTSSVLAIMQFDDTQLDIVRVQAVAPATCVREGTTAGTIAARQIRVTTPNTSTTPFPNGIERALCDIVLRPKATASGGLTALTVPQSTCIDGIGNATNCSTQAGAIGINSLETNPRPGSTLSMSEVVGQPVARDALLIRNAGTATMTGTCSIAAGNGFAVASGANYSVPPGGTVAVGLECTLPGNPDVPVTGGLLSCTTPTDNALGDLFYSLTCDARRPNEPVPESQLRRENLAANAQFGASGANLPNGGGASMAVGAPGAGSDFSGEVYLLGMGPQIAGKSAQRPYALRDITVQGIVSAPRQKNELPDLCFGRSIATTADGTRMAVGAPGRCSAGSTSTDPGRVVIYQRPAEGWGEAYDAGFGALATITAPGNLSGVIAGEFGASVVFQNDGALVVGAPGADTLAADDIGQVYRYARNGAGYVATPIRIPSPNGGVGGGRFGAAVASGEDFLIIGAPGEGAANSRRGMAYVVNFANGEPLPAEPMVATTAAADNTGRSVLVVGNLVFVGVPGADTSVGSNSGAVRVFRRNADGSTLEVARLIPQPPAGGAPSAGANQGLGASLSSNGITLFAGAPDATENGNTRQGRTYAYRIDDRWASTTTSLGDIPATAVLINVGGSANEAFGSAVVVGPGSALIGAPESSLDNGAVQKVGRADLFGMEELFRSSFER